MAVGMNIQISFCHWFESDCVQGLTQMQNAFVRLNRTFSNITVFCIAYSLFHSSAVHHEYVWSLFLLIELTYDSASSSLLATLFSLTWIDFIALPLHHFSHSDCYVTSLIPFNQFTISSCFSIQLQQKSWSGCQLDKTHRALCWIIHILIPLCSIRLGISELSNSHTSSCHTA